MNGKDIISQIHQYLTGFTAPSNGEQKLPSSTINYPLLLLGRVVPSAAKASVIRRRDGRISAALRFD